MRCVAPPIQLALLGAIICGLPSSLVAQTSPESRPKSSYEAALSADEPYPYLVPGHTLLGSDPGESTADPYDLAPTATPEAVNQVPPASRQGIRPGDVFPLCTGDSSLADADPVSQEDKSYGVLLSLDYDAFRGVSDGGWENNGIRTGFNFATRLGPISDLTGIGLQVGASVGVFDWAGTDYRTQNQNRAETQGFLTYGLYRKPTENSRISGGLVQDWMFNDTYGVFGQSPTLSQLRGQLGYATSASNEFGVWGTAHVQASTRDVTGFGPTKWQSVNQLSGYWHHKWHAGGPDTWISVGVPENSRLSGGGSLGDYLVSATAACPFSDAVALYSNVTYLHQSGAPGGESSNDDAWNFTVGISIYPGRNARSSTVAGQRWMPLIPVANNGTFLVDTSQNF